MTARERLPAELRRWILLLGAGQAVIIALLAWNLVAGVLTARPLLILFILAAALALWAGVGLAASSIRRRRAYAAAVQVALRDGEVTPDERAMLDRLAGELGVEGSTR